MIAFARTDTSLLGRWWWTVDRWILVAVVALMAVGAMLAMTASPAIAERMKVAPFYFARRHLMVLGPALALMIAVSVLDLVTVRRLAVAVFALALVLLALTVVAGVEVNGARRWLRVGPVSLQASELVKPAFAVVTAWLFAAYRRDPSVPANHIAAGLCALVLGLLALEPDFSMAAVVAVVWLAQCFLAGLRLRWVALIGAAAALAAVLAYLTMPHVADRFDRFLDPASGDTYQVDTAIAAVMSGGLLGRGPGEGVVKETLPDAHADFVFAVVGEEFGVLFGLALIGLFAFVVLRGFAHAFSAEDPFVMLAVGGLVTQFGVQALFHMGVTLGLVPATGMTLPFVSYGGTSLIAMAFAMGLVLALTRRRPQGALPW